MVCTLHESLKHVAHWIPLLCKFWAWVSLIKKCMENSYAPASFWGSWNKKLEFKAVSTLCDSLKLVTHWMPLLCKVWFWASAIEKTHMPISKLCSYVCCFNASTFLKSLNSLRSHCRKYYKAYSLADCPGLEVIREKSKSSIQTVVGLTH